uniref:BACK domain-containing protein n=1 Tax=Craspedostauros australis TaxID=1486917 RepID=A0A6T6GRB5_9STRA
MVHTLIFADQHDCALLKDAATRMAAQNMQTLLAHPDFSKLIPHHQLMGDIHVLCSEGMVADGGDDEYGGMSMMELYKVVDEDEGAVQVDSYMDRVALLRFVRSITSSRVAESDGAAEEEK